MGICDDMRGELKAKMREKAVHLQMAQEANVLCTALDARLCSWSRPDNLCMLLIPDDFKGLSCEYQRKPND